MIGVAGVAAAAGPRAAADRARAGRSRSRCSSRNLRRDAATALAQVAPQRDVPGLSRLRHAARDRLTLVRLVVTKRRLLEWETAATTAARAAGLVGRHGAAAVRRRDDRRARSSPVAVARRDLRVGAAARCRRPRRSSCCGSSRRSSPTGSACRSAPRVRPLSDDERALLRRTARKTWRYFETFVTEADALAAARQLPGGRRRAAGWRAAPRRPTSA